VTASAPHPEPTRNPAARTLPPRRRPVERAADLRSTAVLRHGALALVADPLGDIRPDPRGLGLYLGDTRVLSSIVLLVDGRQPLLLQPDPGGSDRGSIQLANPELVSSAARSNGTGSLPAQSVGIRRDRALDASGLHESVHIANFTTGHVTLDVGLLLDFDAADIFEIRGYARSERGWLEEIEIDDGVRFAYQGRDGRRLTTTVSFDAPPERIVAAPDDSDGSVASVWHLSLEGGGFVSLAWTVAAEWTPPRPRGLVLRPERPARGRGAIADAHFEADDGLLNSVVARSLADVDQLETAGPGPGESFLAAGVPWFATLFGRDALISALFLLPVRPSVAADTLRTLGRLQATGRHDAQDAEPGKILHELRTGEMAATGEVPFARYYGTADATPLWLLLLAAHHAWTGDDRLVAQLWPKALRAVAWLEAKLAYGGLVSYQTRAPNGLRNQGWKDSADSVRDRTGAIAEPPIALIEVQAYAIGAFRAMAGLADRRGDDALATRLRGRGEALRERLETEFWCPDLDRYAMAIYGAGQRADALASNVAHALWQGVVGEDRAARVARDLAGPGMDSGWGLRTYAAGQPGYNPMSYHVGSVWPHDVAIAIAGLRRYGFDAEAAKLANGLLDAARAFPMFRLPEVFCGFGRDEADQPVAYPVSCAPQAWAAAAPFFVLEALLGLEADAPGRILRVVRPILPRPVRRLTVTGLRVGDAEVDLQFGSGRSAVDVEVLRRRGDLAVHVEA
jgi:glycogen debranching enzyme